VEIRVALAGFSPILEKQLTYLLAQTSNKNVKVSLSALNVGKRPDILIVDFQTQGGRMNATMALKMWPSLPVYAVSEADPLPESVVRVKRSQVFSGLSKLLREKVSELSAQQHDVVVDEAVLNGPKQVNSAVQKTDGQNLSKGRVLVVDDSAVAREHLVHFLQGQGMRVDQAGSAEEARNWLSRNKYDGLFLDVNMQGMDGYTFCREIRQHKEHRELGVVMVTSRDGLIDKARGALAGCKAYITKPVQADKIIAGLNLLLLNKLASDASAADQIPA
jgi:two-component system, cell cycle response regulator